MSGQAKAADVMVARAAIDKMFRRGWIDICAIDEVIKLLGVIPDGECYGRLRALHCVHIREMERDLQYHIPAWINGALGGPRMSADSIPALGGSASANNVQALIGTEDVTQDDALDRLRMYEAVREDQRAQDDAARRGVCCG